MNSEDAIKPPPNVLLSGIVGSHAYGLAHDRSDTDRLGVFAAPTASLLGLHLPEESRVTFHPDVTFHEAGKVAALALKCNPAVTEIMWLPGELYETRTELGNSLIAIRQRFLSRPYVSNAYLEYATQQFRRLARRAENPDRPAAPDRVAKHARHLWRLCLQCVDLWLTGELTLRLNNGDAADCRKFGEAVAAGDLEIARDHIRWARAVVYTTPTTLPETADEAAVEAWLQQVRRTYYQETA